MIDTICVAYITSGDYIVVRNRTKGTLEYRVDDVRVYADRVELNCTARFNGDTAVFTFDSVLDEVMQISEPSRVCDVCSDLRKATKSLTYPMEDITNIISRTIRRSPPPGKGVKVHLDYIPELLSALTEINKIAQENV